MIITEEVYKKSSDKYFSSAEKIKSMVSIYKIVVITLILVFAFSHIAPVFVTDERTASVLSIIEIHSFRLAVLSPFILTALCLTLQNLINKNKTVYVIRGTKAILDYNKSPFSQKTADSLKSAISSVKNRNTAYYLCCLLFNSYMMNGDFISAYDTLYEDKKLFEKRKYREIDYQVLRLVYYSEGSPDIVNAEAAYNRINEIFHSIKKSENDFLLCSSALNADIRYAYIRKDYASCAELLSLKIQYLHLRIKQNAAERIFCASDKLMLAECLYNIGKYDEALRICDEAGPMLVNIQYRLDKANALAAKLHALTDCKG